MLGVEQKSSPNGAGTMSVQDRIRAKHQAAQGRKTLDLIVPGYDGDLGVRYRAIEAEHVGKLEAAAGNIGAQVNANLDGLIAACECILVRDAQGDLSPLVVDEHGTVTPDGEIAYFDDRLAAYLGIECETAREIVLQLFAALPAPYLGASKHAERVVKWMAGEQESGLERLLGES